MRRASIESASESSAGPAARGRVQEGGGYRMREILRTNDPVRLSWAQAVLRDAGIEFLVLDHHTSIVEGSIGAIPRRLMVSAGDEPRARSTLLAAEGELS